MRHTAVTLKINWDFPPDLTSILLSEVHCLLSLSRGSIPSAPFLMNFFLWKTKTREHQPNVQQEINKAQRTRGGQRGGRRVPSLLPPAAQISSWQTASARRSLGQSIRAGPEFFLFETRRVRQVDMNEKVWPPRVYLSLYLRLPPSASQETKEGNRRELK